MFHICYVHTEKTKSEYTHTHIKYLEYINVDIICTIQTHQHILLQWQNRDFHQ